MTLPQTGETKVSPIRSTGIYSRSFHHCPYRSSAQERNLNLTSDSLVSIAVTVVKNMRLMQGEYCFCGDHTRPLRLDDIRGEVAT